MFKLFLPLLFLLSGGVRASGSADLNAMTLESLRELARPAVPSAAVPPRAPGRPQTKYFNAYVLKAVDQLYAKYGKLGYDINSILTHDITYHTFGVIPARRAPLTMCVAAQMEIILTAFEIYARETGDYSLYGYLPKSSFERLSVTDLKGHIWVNPAFNANGTADALINFGMGERRSFEELDPGDFINLNRTNRTGHAVTFLGYIDGAGTVLPKYTANVIGFKYFSSQGRAAAGEGGFDFRYAVFSKFGCPAMPYNRDCGVLYSANQALLNTGAMLGPESWTGVMPQAAGDAPEDTVFDGSFFDGVTTDD